MKGKEKRSVKWRFMGILLLCWLIPVALVMGMMGYYVAGNHFSNQVENYQKQLDYSSEVTVERLNRAIAASREASSDGALKEAYSQYQRGNWDYNRLYKQCEIYLTDQYRQNDLFYHTVLWFYEEPEGLNVGIYNERANGSYQQIKTYWEKDHEKIFKFAEGLDTSVGFFQSEGRLYMVRNLVSSDFKPYGALIMGLNQGECFGSLMNIPSQEKVTCILEGERLDLTGGGVDMENLSLDFQKSRSGYVEQEQGLYVYQREKTRDYQLQTVVKMDVAYGMLPFYGYEFLMAAMFLSLVPLMLWMLLAFRRQVTQPVEVLMKASKEIEKGNLGYQVEQYAANLEFQYLTDSFNHMSERLKNQFERIFKEEIALKDARIMALQSHINPHFMNNTLEIINWEARLAGDTKVTNMIEALSILMDAAIDRKKKPEVELHEEMVYVSAYLYITKERLGKRLEVANELPEDIMDCHVPRLILQPVIENAIEHGIVQKGRGRVVLRGWKEEGFLKLEIQNDGSLSADKEKFIEKLLKPDYNTSKASSGSMGIANVNQRLRILYGEPCGLTIQQDGQGHVISRLTIAIRETAQNHTTNHTLSYLFSPENT